MKLVLFNYWRSSASQRVRIGLGLKQLAYEYVAIHIVKRDQHAADYAARNPMQQVPTLELTEDDGRVHTLVQSLPILEFLDERFPGAPLLPVDPYARARARALAEVINAGVQPMQNLTTTKKLKELGVDDQAWARSFITAGLAAYQQLAAETAGAFSIGDSPTIADCCLVPQLASARRFEVSLEPFAALTAIEARCLALPAFAAAQPDRQPDAQK